MAVQCDVIKKSGSWFTYEGEQLGQGRENVRQFLKDNPAITEEISDKVKVAFGLMKPEDQFVEVEDEDDNSQSVSSSSADNKTNTSKGSDVK